MDGKDMRRRLRQLIGETEYSEFLDPQTEYDFLYEAGKQWVIETECLTAEQEITTVASQAGYTLNGDFLGLYLKEEDVEDYEAYYLKYYDGTDYTFINFKSYSEVIHDNNTTAQTIPDAFTIIDDTTLDTIISDTADNAADDVGGKTILTMNTAIFTDITPGDIIHNTTDESAGPVVYVDSAYKIIHICLFGGTDNEIDANDSFIIQPRKRLKLQFDPPPSTKDHTATLYYLRKPSPVYSDYDVYQIPFDYHEALVRYAAWLIKYRDDEPNFGDAFYAHWKKAIEDYGRLTNKAFLKHESRIIPRLKR